MFLSVLSRRRLQSLIERHLTAAQNKKMFYTYILYSESADKFYIGQTSNMSERIIFHNKGYQTYTKKYIPWKLVLSIEKETRSEAIILERKLKNLNRERLIAFIDKYKLH